MGSDVVEEDASTSQAVLEQDDINQNPVLVCLYGAGVTPAQGRTQLEKFMQAASSAGLSDQVVLDHFALGENSCSGIFELADRMVANLDEDPRYEGRKILLFSHSLGCLYAFFMIKRLGDRVLKFYPLAYRPPFKGAMVDAFGVDTFTKLAKQDDAKLLKGMVGTWNSDFLAMFVGKPAADLPPMAKAVLDLIRSQLTSPLMPTGPKELKALKAGNPAEFEPITIPILAVTGGSETKLGETPTRVKKWSEHTRGEFNMEVIEGANHSSLLYETKDDTTTCSKTHDVVITDMLQFVK